MREWGWQRSAGDRALEAVLWGAAALVALVFLALVGQVVWQGLGVVDVAFLTEAPRDAGRAGGVWPILVSTVSILLVCLAVTVPVGLGTALFVTEVTPSGGRWARWLGRSLDVLGGAPSIVFGLFGNALFCQVLGLGFSILSGGLTLACMALPLFIRATEVGLRSVPAEVRMSAAALGLSRTTTMVRLLLPGASRAIVAGLVLAVGRALAETAALIFTSGYVDRTPESLLDSGRALSVHIYDLSMNVAGGERAAWGSALVLLVLLLVAHLWVSWMMRRWVQREYEV